MASFNTSLHCTDIARHNLLITSAVPKKYCPSDWIFDTKLKFHIANEQEKLAERVIEESNRVADETRETTKSWKQEVDHNLKERIEEINFLIEELKKQREAAVSQEKELKANRTRIETANKFLKEKSLDICQRCIIYRDHRIGADLVEDEVDLQLRQEMKVIKGTQSGLLEKALIEINECIRRLRAAIYILDRDLINKEKTKKIDEANLLLKETQQGLSVYQGGIPLNVCDYTLDEWKYLTYKNIENTAKEINSANQLYAYIEILLKQLVEDLRNQTERTNEAFKRRISEITYAKKSLESKHCQTMEHITNVRDQITKIERELAEKEGYLAVCQMRLGNRAQRIGLELTCDAVQNTLQNELNALKDTISKLHQKHTELRAVMRYLLHVQVMQEEEINVKTNSLKIDEVDCMTLRQALIYTTF